MALETVLIPYVEAMGWEAAHARFAAELATDDETAVALRHLVCGWVAVEGTKVDEAAANFAQVDRHPRFGGLARVGEALLAMRMKDGEAVERSLTLAATYIESDPKLSGLIDHVRGTKAAHDGDVPLARECLFRAVEKLGERHYAYGRALDTLGNLYLNQDNFLTSRLLFTAALECKTRTNDRRGMALTHGQLGRLFLNWGYYSRAEHHFLEDLRLAEELNDAFGQTRMHGALGQVRVQAMREARLQGNAETANEHARQARDWLQACIAGSQQKGFGITEGYARKDLSIVCGFQDDRTAAERELTAARALFAAKRFAEGLAHVDRQDAVLHACRGQWEAARTLLQSVLAYFAQTNDWAEAAATRIELARLAVRAGDPPTVVERALQEALRAAEACRRTSLVCEVEHELRAYSPTAYWNQLFQRVRGRSIHDEASTLVAGTRETATIFYLDLQGWSTFAHGRDPEDVMMTINQLMAEAADVLRRYGAQSISWRGDGFLALVRGTEHASRAVETGLDLVAAIESFNRPRRLLGLPDFQCRIGISTGEVYLGNVGTYEKMDYTGVGTMMNLGARLEANALTSKPCISRTTYDLVKHRFTYAPENPRRIEAKGIGEQMVWDVVGRAAPVSRGKSDSAPPGLSG
jgi:class 3 adenylate cyclase